MALDRDSILAANKLRKEEVQVPEWGGTVWVREMTATERDAYQVSILEMKKGAKGRVEMQPNMQDATAKLLLHCLVDDEGEQLFTDIGEIRQLAAAPVNRLLSVAQRLNAMGDEAMEELVGNSGGGESDTSNSRSASELESSIPAFSSTR